MGWEKNTLLRNPFSGYHPATRPSTTFKSKEKRRNLLRFNGKNISADNSHSPMLVNSGISHCPFLAREQRAFRNRLFRFFRLNLHFYNLSWAHNPAKVQGKHSPKRTKDQEKNF
ncbi:hypothetical protein TNCT_108661 [Trichonephila clavata]|uniref:Uncharacterized protein n=1 Tax=Trichonephila clavata TaxID=2740835 RepID=A0A8X6KI84_TRICU|nr:hypothetical protein TNCT_108661 [Trichonephila clavata]